MENRLATISYIFWTDILWCLIFYSRLKPAPLGHRGPLYIFSARGRTLIGRCCHRYHRWRQSDSHKRDIYTRLRYRQLLNILVNYNYVNYANHLMVDRFPKLYRAKVHMRNLYLSSNITSKSGLFIKSFLRTYYGIYHDCNDRRFYSRYR